MGMDIRDSIAKDPLSRYQTQAIGICLMINMLDGFDVLVMAFTASSVAGEWNLPASQLGILLSASLFGMAAGSLFLAPLADRVGRRPLVLICLFVISVGMLLSAASQNAVQLALLRAITGVGIGGMLASLNVLVSEYSSDKWRSMAVSSLQSGYPIGAVLGGIVAAFLIGQYGWRSVFLLGSIASFLMIPLVVYRLPESFDFLLSKQPHNALEKVNNLRQLMGKEPVAHLPEKERMQTASGVGSLFSSGHKNSTLLVWLSFFMVMFSFYFVLSWTPKLLVASGLSTEGGITAGVLINLGGVAGGLLLGYISSRMSLGKLLVFYMLATAIFMMVFGLFSSSMSLALGIGILIGFFLFGSMIGLYALVPNLYPAPIRATGMGWAIGIGRLGAILSPLLAGALLDLQWPVSTLFMIFSAPLLISLVAIQFTVQLRQEH